MKHLNYLFITLICILFASCMGEDYADPANIDNPYGNNEIHDTNVVTIAKLKEMYKTVLNTDYRDGQSYTQVTDDVKIKAYVTGNDVQGNLYNEIAVQDSTGAIIIAIAQGGIFGYLPVGTEILVDLKDLYIGNYAMQPEIGTPYTNSSGNTYVSRMSRFLWQDHFRITGKTATIEPEVFTTGSKKTTWSLDDDAAKLGIIKNVSFKGITPISMYADPAGKTSVSWYFNEQGTDVMVYTSPYCDFASNKLPQGKCNITGIVKRYNKKWEFIIRSIDDVEEL